MRCLLILLIWLPALPAQKSAKHDPAKKFFASAPVITISITLPPESRQQLRDRPREYVKATIAIDGEKHGWADIGIKLKGAAGSFREIDDRPGFTINLKKFGGKETLHGLKRFHLNNGAQDDSFLSEWIGSEIFTAAGYPAPRVGHACVTLDGEFLGLYVLREGYDKQFLMRTIGDQNGNLYDGGFCQDINASLEKDSGDGPDDYRDLESLHRACKPERSTNYTDTKARLYIEAAIDLPKFIDFMALEAMLGHWDGYCQNRNNFRLWCSLENGQSLFFPHGMDQLFGEADAPILQHPSAIVASAVQSRAEWRKLYRDRLSALLPLFKARPLAKKLKARGKRIYRVLQKYDRDAARDQKRELNELIRRITSRYAHLQKQVKEPEPKPLTIQVDSAAKLKTWNSAGETSKITLKKRSFKGSPSLQIRCAAKQTNKERRGAYRTTVLLSKGKYRFSVMARCEDVDGIPSANRATDGGVRCMAGGKSSEPLLGKSKWTTLHCDFEVTKFRRNVELRFELRSYNGTAWFRINSLQIERLEAP